MVGGRGLVASGQDPGGLGEGLEGLGQSGPIGGYDVEGSEHCVGWRGGRDAGLVRPLKGDSIEGGLSRRRRTGAGGVTDRRGGRRATGPEQPAAHGDARRRAAPAEEGTPAEPAGCLGWVDGAAFGHRYLTSIFSAAGIWAKCSDSAARVAFSWLRSPS